MEASAASHFPRALAAWTSGLCGGAFDKSDFTASKLASYPFQQPRICDLIKGFREAESGHSSSEAADGMLDRLAQEGAKALDQLKLDEVIAAGLQGYNLAHLIILNVVRTVSLRELRKKNAVLAKVLLCSRSTNNLQLLPIELAALLPDQEQVSEPASPEGEGQAVVAGAGASSGSGSGPGSGPGSGAASTAGSNGGSNAGSNAGSIASPTPGSTVQPSAGCMNFKAVLRIYVELRLTAVLDLPRIAQLAVESGNVSALRCLSEDKLVPLGFPPFEQIVRSQFLHIYSVITPASYAFLWDHFALLGKEDVMKEPDCDGVRPIHAATLLGSYYSLELVRRLSPDQMFELAVPSVASTPADPTATGQRKEFSRDQVGLSPLSCAVLSRSVVALSVVLSIYRKTLSEQQMSVLCEIRDEIGFTFLHYAVLVDNPDVLQVAIRWAPSAAFFRETAGKATEAVAKLFRRMPENGHGGFTPLQLLMVMDSGFAFCTCKMARRMSRREVSRQLASLECACSLYSGNGLPPAQAGSTSNDSTKSEPGGDSDPQGENTTTAPSQSSTKGLTLASLGHVFSDEPCPVPFNISTALWCNSLPQRARESSPAWILHLMVLGWSAVTFALVPTFSREGNIEETWRWTTQYTLATLAILFLLGLRILPLFNRKVAQIDLDSQELPRAGTVCAYCLTLVRSGDVDYSARGESAHCDRCGSCIRDRLFHSRALGGCITSKTVGPVAALFGGLLLVVMAGPCVGFTADFRLDGRFLAHFVISMAAVLSIGNLIGEDLMSARDRAKLVLMLTK